MSRVILLLTVAGVLAGCGFRIDTNGYYATGIRRADQGKIVFLTNPKPIKPNEAPR